jgi:hypothetical protein
MPVKRTTHAVTAAGIKLKPGAWRTLRLARGTPFRVVVSVGCRDIGFFRFQLLKGQKQQPAFQLKYHFWSDCPVSSRGRLWSACLPGFVGFPLFFGLLVHPQKGMFTLSLNSESPLKQSVLNGLSTAIARLAQR